MAKWLAITQKKIVSTIIPLFRGKSFNVCVSSRPFSSVQIFFKWFPTFVFGHLLFCCGLIIYLFTGWADIKSRKPQVQMSSYFPFKENGPSISVFHKFSWLSFWFIGESNHTSQARETWQEATMGLTGHIGAGPIWGMVPRAGLAGI